MIKDTVFFCVILSYYQFHFLGSRCVVLFSIPVIAYSCFSRLTLQSVQSSTAFLPQHSTAYPDIACSQACFRDSSTYSSLLVI